MKEMPRERYDVFYSTVCHLCKDPCEEGSPSYPLKKCQGCKLISYCSVDHQRMNWIEHKFFCKTVQSLMKCFNVPHLFAPASSLSYAKWSGIRTSMKMHCEMMLKRPLSMSETQMLFFPSVCFYCRKVDQGNLKTCPNCQSVTYCSDEHLEDDVVFHIKQCKELKFGFDLDMVTFHGSLPDINLEFGGRNVCDSTENFCIEFSKFASASNKHSDRLASAMYYNMLSCPLTFIHTVFQTGLHLSRKLTVHIIGAGNLEAYQLPMWDMAFHWLSNLTELHLILIGPDVYAPPQFNVCSVCEKAGCRLAVQFFPEYLYHEYVASSKVTTPDIIVMYNCGLSEFTGSKKDTWEKSIPLILSSNCPVMMTSYTVMEAKLDLDLIKLRDENIKVLVECERNIFSGQKPFRDWENFCSQSDSLVFYENGFKSILVPKTFSLPECPPP